mmetsp:Transcript_20201/g.56844  ORF Transcript_20201/g.56844 Transcript_20201/m.56844 type:complete len:332 (-) Transcript_20201:181-1176(-)
MRIYGWDFLRGCVIYFFFYNAFLLEANVNDEERENLQVKKFVIITIGRSGHSWLVSLLRSHPQILGLYHEPLTSWWWGTNSEAMREWLSKGFGWTTSPLHPTLIPNQASFNPPSKLKHLLNETSYRQGMEGNIQETFRKIRNSGNYAIGLSTKLNGLPTNFDKQHIKKFFLQHNFSVIFQSRRNLVEGSISELTFTQSVGKSVHKGIRGAAVHVPEKQFCHHLRNRVKKQNEMSETEYDFRLKGCKCLSIWYEDQVKHLSFTLRSVLEFLGLNTEIDEMYSNIKKWSPSKLSERIENFKPLLNQTCGQNLGNFICGEISRLVCLDFFSDGR